MELCKVSVNITLVLAVPNDHEPTDKEIAKALKDEICANGFFAGERKTTWVIHRRDVPNIWKGSIPWSTKKRLNREERTVAEILDEKNSK
jgi:hypothetical protein